MSLNIRRQCFFLLVYHTLSTTHGLLYVRMTALGYLYIPLMLLVPLFKVQTSYVEGNN